MKTTIALGIIAITLAGIVKAGEQDKGKAIPAKEWKEHFAVVGMPETMRSTKFLGIKNGLAVIQVQKMNPLSEKWTTTLYKVKVADLEPGFRAEVEKADAALKNSADGSKAKSNESNAPQ
jgi:hypothetical protein